MVEVGMRPVALDHAEPLELGALHVDPVLPSRRRGIPCGMRPRRRDQGSTTSAPCRRRILLDLPFDRLEPWQSQSTGFGSRSKPIICCERVTTSLEDLVAAAVADVNVRPAVVQRIGRPSSCEDELRAALRGLPARARIEARLPSARRARAPSAAAQRAWGSGAWAEDDLSAVVAFGVGHNLGISRVWDGDKGPGLVPVSGQTKADRAGNSPRERPDDRSGYRCACRGRVSSR